MKLKTILILLTVVVCNSLQATTFLNSGHNTMDVIWTIRGVYVPNGNFVSSLSMPNGSPIFIHDREEELGQYSDIRAGMVANFAQDNQLDSLAISLAISSNVSIFSSISVFFNLSVAGDDTTMRAYFLPTGASGVAGILSLGPLDYPINDPSITTDGVELTAGTDHRASFLAYMPSGQGSISGSIVLTFDREINSSDVALLSSVPEPSTAMFGALAIVAAMCRRMRFKHNATKA